MRFGPWLVAGVASFALASAASAQLGDSSFDQFDHPAIEYLARPAHDPVAALSRRMDAGDLPLSFDAQHGYLPALLKALDIPTESQVVAFSKTSTQLNLINPSNPRAVYFNDSVSIGWTRGTFVLELASQDPVLGTIFYELDQHRVEKPMLRRTRACLRCHHSLYTNGVPGRLVRSMATAGDGTTLAGSDRICGVVTLMIKPPSDGTEPSLVVEQHFDEAAKARVPSKARVRHALYRYHVHVHVDDQT
jgi:hypothetical protein